MYKISVNYTIIKYNVEIIFTVPYLKMRMDIHISNNLPFMPTDIIDLIISSLPPDKFYVEIWNGSIRMKFTPYKSYYSYQQLLNCFTN